MVQVKDLRKGDMIALSGHDGAPRYEVVDWVAHNGTPYFDITIEGENGRTMTIKRKFDDLVLT